MTALIANIVKLVLQLITAAAGVLVTFGIALDPAQIDAFKQAVGDLGAHATGIALIVSSLSASVPAIIKSIREQMDKSEK